MNRLLDHLRRVLEEPLSDADLLERFVERQEQTSFAALLKRHGPMVLGVCQRILGNAQDAEDAFQATFLVLVRKAASVRPRETVGNWLYGVAYRTALEARAKLNRRRAREKQVEEMPDSEEQQQSCCFELLALLDREVHRLPDKYRLPVILCDLEGRSRKEVARQMGIPEGTLSSRLAAAHKKLAWRLARLGLTASGASLAMLLAENTASAHVPPLLVAATSKAAVGKVVGLSAGVLTLTEGVLQTMFLAKIKTATMVLCGVAALGLGTGGIVYQTRVGADDSLRLGQRIAAVNPDDDDDAPQQKDRAKRAAEEARLREALRAQVDKARKEAQAQRDQAEAQRRKAEEALRNLKEQLAKARQGEKQARQQGNRGGSADKAPKSPQQDLKGLDNLSAAEAKTREAFKRQRQMLQDQMKKLDVEERETLRKIGAERTRLLQQQKRQSEGDRAASSGDKLDRILERLERMERRLDRLERGRNP